MLTGSLDRSASTASIFLLDWERAKQELAVLIEQKNSLYHSSLKTLALFLAGFLGFNALGAPSGVSAVSGQLLAGTAKISITPETEEPIHDPVYVRSLVLEIIGERLAFVSADLAVFTSDRVEKSAKKNTAWPNYFFAPPTITRLLPSLARARARTISKPILKTRPSAW